MKVFALVLPLLVLATGASSQEAQELATYSGPKDKLHIYILVGQSNMSGRAKVEDEDRQIPKQLYLFDSKAKWVQATHPFIQYTNVTNGADLGVIKAGGKTGLNLGLSFARKMLDAYPGVSVGLVVNSQGGSAIKTWLRGGKNYEKTMERIRPIKDSGVIKGFLWHQGESDEKMGEKYLEPLKKVIEQFREDLNDPRLPFVAGQIAPLPKNKEVIEAFNAGLLKLPMQVLQTGVARTEGFKGDDVHFGSEETRKLGERYAEEMLKLQGK